MTYYAKELLEMLAEYLNKELVPFLGNYVGECICVSQNQVNGIPEKKSKTLPPIIIVPVRRSASEPVFVKVAIFRGTVSVWTAKELSVPAKDLVMSVVNNFALPYKYFKHVLFKGTV